MLFHIAIHKDKESVYGTSVPALPGCYSYGETLEEAIAHTKEAILFHLEGELEDGKEPEISPITLDDIHKDPNYQGAHLVTLELDISPYTLKTERFNVSWPKYLIAQVDSYTKTHHTSRSGFLIHAAKYYIDHHSGSNSEQNSR